MEINELTKIVAKRLGLTELQVHDVIGTQFRLVREIIAEDGNLTPIQLLHLGKFVVSKGRQKRYEETKHIQKEYREKRDKRLKKLQDEKTSRVSDGI